MNTHLSKPEEQSAPLHRVLEVLQSLERVVLLGDFNATPEHPALQQLRNSGVVDAISVSNQNSSRVDWILVRGLHVHQMIGLDPEALRHAFSIPDDAEAFTALAIGHLDTSSTADPAHKARDNKPRSRIKQTEFVFSDRFGNPASFQA